MGDIPLDFDTLQPYGCFIGSAAVIVLSDQDSARDAARNMMRFFAHESCGQCTPCRNGTAKASALMDQPTAGTCRCWTTCRMVMRDASICGLGQAAPNPVDCVIKYFPHELELKDSGMNALTRKEADALRRADRDASRSTAARCSGACRRDR